MAEAGAPMRLKEWLVAQVESGQYPGLRWEDSGKRLFRIPWKHAAKQDYRQQEDAALFKAWAIYKGKYHEGVDKADPSVWKTRLRCALNKSIDFKEVPERSHLEISEPYKVYQIVSDVSQEMDKEKGQHPLREPRQPPSSAQQETGANCQPNQAAAQLESSIKNTESTQRAGASSDAGQDLQEEPVAMCLTSPGSPQASQKPSPSDHLGNQVKGYFYSWSPAHFRCHPSPRFVGPSTPGTDNETINSDCWLHIRLYYCDMLVKEATTSTAEGCRITYRPVPADNESLYGPSAMEQIQFPSPGMLAGNSPVARAVVVLERLLPHLHRGLLLWVAPEGVFMKRQCQVRVYWKGPLAPHHDRPNKLEREKTYKLLDTQQFLQQLRGYLSHGDPPPQYQIHFCFGEEYPAAPNQKLHKFITARVEPVFARDLCLYAQRLGPRSLQDSQQCSSDAPRDIVQILKQLCSP